MMSSTTLLPFQPDAMTPAQLAAVSYLARYTGQTHTLYAHQLRRWFTWCETIAVRVPFEEKDLGPPQADGPPMLPVVLAAPPIQGQRLDIRLGWDLEDSVHRRVAQVADGHHHPLTPFALDLVAGAGRQLCAVE